MLLLDRIIQRLNNFLLLIAGGAAAAIMILAVGNMIIRAIYRPFGATFEVIAFLSAIVTSFAFGATQIKKIHITVDLLFDRLPQRIRRPVEIIVYLLNVILFSTITWQMILYAGRLHQRSYVSDSLQLPLSPIVYAVAFGLAFLDFVIFMDLLRLLKERYK